MGRHKVKQEPLPRGLAPREKEVLRLVVAGYTNKQIATSLNLAENTIKVYLGRIQCRMTRVSLVGLALYIGLVSTDEVIGMAQAHRTPENEWLFKKLATDAPPQEVTQ